MRVLGYIRLSRETEETTSPARQREIIEAWAKLYGYIIVGWATDLDVSGAVSPWDRPDLGVWLTDDRATEWDIIVGAKLDRISRKLFHFAQLVVWCEDRQKAIASATEPINTSDKFGKMLANFIAMFAEFERDIIQDRTESSRRKAISDGRWHGGRIPYGYIPEKQAKGEGWRLVPDPTSSKQFLEIVKWFLSGDSLFAIANRLNDAGVPSPTDYYRRVRGDDLEGIRWTAQAIGGLLRSRTPLGVTERGGKIIRGDDGLPIMRAKPIISRSDWDLVQERLERQSNAPRRMQSTSPLLGIAFCLSCGMPLYRTGRKSSTGKVYRYYRCRSKVEKRGCGALAVPEPALMELVNTLMTRSLADVEMMREVHFPAQSHSQELLEAEESLADLIRTTAGKPDAVKRVYEKQIESLEQVIESLSALPDTPAKTEYHPTGALYGDLWSASDADERRKLLLQSGVRMEVAQASGPTISVGRFGRPDRYDQAIELGIYDKIQFAFYVPRDLRGRVARQSGL